MKPVTLQEIEFYDSHPQKMGDERRFLCSLSDVCRSKPRDAAHRSLTVNTRTGFFICHRCGAKGKLKEFWEMRPKLSKKQLAAQKLSARFTASALRSAKEQIERLSENQIEKFKSYQASFAGSAAAEYLRRRGVVPPEIAEKAGCGYAAAWEHWEKREGKWLLTRVDRRVVFPICGEGGELVAIHGRAIDEENHHNSSKITKGDKSLGVFSAMPEALAAKVVAICEGAIDALALAVCGVAAVAMTGTTAPDWLFKKLAFRHVLLATDADEAGDKAAARLRLELEQRGTKFFRLRPRRAKDWAEVLEMRGAAKLAEFLAPFAVAASDELRADAAWQLFQKGRAEAAKFVADLIDDGEAREYLREKIKANPKQ
jgi:DNA primase